MTEDKKKIEGLVAGVITERELAINIGSDAGVESGMKFKVLANTPTEIRDPETDNLLGTITREKVRVRASSVSKKFSICRTYTSYRTRGGALYAAGIGNPLERPRTVYETLRADESEYLPDLPEDESYVKKGDKVQQILDDD